MQAKIAALEERANGLVRENYALRELVAHCWVHSGYQNCGYGQMDSEMRSLYDEVIKVIVSKLDEP